MERRPGATDVRNLRSEVTRLRADVDELKAAGGLNGTRRRLALLVALAAGPAFAQHDAFTGDQATDGGIGFTSVVVFFVVLWLACGLIARRIVRSRGGSGAGGFLLGFLVGPVGVIVALLMPYKPTSGSDGDE